MSLKTTRLRIILEANLRSKSAEHVDLHIMIDLTAGNVLSGFDELFRFRLNYFHNMLRDQLTYRTLHAVSLIDTILNLLLTWIYKWCVSMQLKTLKQPKLYEPTMNVNAKKNNKIFQVKSHFSRRKKIMNN